MNHWMESARRWVGENPLASLLLAGGLVYIFNAWTPSSYGLVLEQIGIHGYGPEYGEARPIRSDEWIVSTPYFQIAVKNHFKRFNQASPYHEDLRNFFPVPLWDWSLVFKPQLWAFFVLDPARALSIYYYFFIFSFIFGFFLLFKRLNIGSGAALLGAVFLFFSRFTQVWWSSNAPTLALAPWVAVLFLSGRRGCLAWAGVFYAAAAWLFGHLYPPFIISVAFAFAVLILACRRDSITWENSLMLLAMTGLAAGLVYLYYRDVFAVMRSTVYPGQRIAHGGGENPLLIWAHFFPYCTAVKFHASFLNDCEIGVVGSYLGLMTVWFLDYRASGAACRKHGFKIGWLLAGLLYAGAWLVFPMPTWMGRILLWNFVPPERMLWGFGVLLTACLILAFHHLPWRMSGWRTAGFIVSVILGWLIFKAGRGDVNLWRNKWDWEIAVAGLLIYFGWKGRWRFFTDARAVKGYLGWAAAGLCIITFGRFNPLQSAVPIFHLPQSSQVESWRKLAEHHPKKWLALEGHYGAYLNGLGLPAINHVLVAPQLSFFKSSFPEMDPGKFNQVFNRYAHIVLTADADEPRNPQADVIEIPFEKYAESFPVVVLASRPPQAPPGGSIESISVRPLGADLKRVVIRGWGDFVGLDSAQKLILHDPEGRIRKIWMTRVVRPDIGSSLRDARKWASGYLLMADARISKSERPEVFVKNLALHSFDSIAGSFALAMAGTVSGQEKGN